jgi:hypothetical protein
VDAQFHFVGFGPYPVEANLDFAVVGSVVAHNVVIQTQLLDYTFLAREIPELRHD